MIHRLLKWRLKTEKQLKKVKELLSIQDNVYLRQPFMTNDSFTSALGAEPLYTAFFEALTSSSYLLHNDTPRYTILAATPQILQYSGLPKDAVVGRGLFETFPSNPKDSADTGENNLRDSLDYVLQNKKPHQLPIQRYDVIDDQGQFVERYWKAENKPVLAPDGTVAYIIHTTEDITQQIKTENRETQLEGIEKAYHLFMHLPGVIGLVKGSDHILELANKNAFQLWGKGPEIIGKPLKETLPELEGQGVFELLEEVRTTGKPKFRSDVPISTMHSGSKETRYFDLFYQPIYDKESIVPVGVFTLSNDVTDRVLAKRKVKESEVRFRTMAEHTPILIAVGDETSNAIYFNKAWTDLTGRPIEELLQFGWVDLVHPEDKERYVNIYLDAFAIKGPFTGEFRVINPQGEYHWLLAHGTARFDTDGHFVGYISACIDITEQKISQQQLQTALEQVRLSKEAAELGTFDMDLEKGTMHWDARCRILFGISHQGAVTYEKDFVEGLHPDDRERILKVIDGAFVQSISNGDYDVEYRTVGAEDGVIRWVRAKGKVYFNQQEKPVRFIGSVLDITDQVNALQKVEETVAQRTQELAHVNEALVRINQELQRSNTHLEEFAHAASHDMKEPIRKVLTFSDRLKKSLDTRLTETEKQLFDRIESATQRMGLLVDDLLEFSHVSEQPLEKEEVDLNKKLSKVLMDLELQIEEKKATIQVGALPVVKGYKRQLQQLLQNLIGNALKYNKPDIAPVVTITCHNVMGKEAPIDILPEEKEQVFHLLEIKDNGIGFEQQYADRIFRMFQRLHGKAEYPGTGVGLAIARKVVDNHHGYIWAESLLGKGSTFKVLLPTDN